MTIIPDYHTRAILILDQLVYIQQSGVVIELIVD